MAKNYRIVFECYKDGEIPEIAPSQTILSEGKIEKSVDVFTFGLTHKSQINLIQSAQDALLKEQMEILEPENCVHCGNKKFNNNGRSSSNYYDIFTDHRITFHRKRCSKCGCEARSATHILLGDSRSAALIKVQTELGAKYSYRDGERLLEMFCGESRQINNHDRIKNTVEEMGAAVEDMHKTENEMIAIEPAKELIISVDGGHINTTEEGKRSFEAMTAVVYRPSALISNGSGTRNHLTSKHCAASALNDGQQQMISNTIIAALKEGLCPQTAITALCDGAENCWRIVDALRPFAASVTCILDWFHLSMKISNIALPDNLKPQLESVKWHLWHGQVNEALNDLETLINTSSRAHKLRLEKLYTYVKNNADKIVNYDERQNDGLVFTSNLAESTVESLINQRCKGQQHMRWSREGLNPLLQLRAIISSNDWKTNWKTAILHSISKSI